MESEKSLKCIHTVFDSTWTKYGKYRVELSFLGEEKQVFWLTEKQMSKLDDCFNLTPKGYSCKKATVYAVIEEREDGKDRFCWCGVETPYKSDLPFLEEKFGVSQEYGYIVEEKHTPAQMEVPATVEVAHELKD